jgi:hypothetical protein
MYYEGRPNVGQKILAGHACGQANKRDFYLDRSEAILGRSQPRPGTATVF